MSLRILVTGSRDWEDQFAVTRAIRAEARRVRPEDVMVVHGNCRSGADADAEFVARIDGFQIERHPAAWAAHGKRAGYIRNQEMVDAGADVCLAFIRNASRGATMCAKLAEDAGIPTLRFEAS